MTNSHFDRGHRPPLGTARICRETETILGQESPLIIQDNQTVHPPVTILETNADIVAEGDRRQGRSSQRCKGESICV